MNAKKKLQIFYELAVVEDELEDFIYLRTKIKRTDLEFLKKSKRKKMKIKDLEKIEKVTAYIEPFKKNIKCKVEKFVENKCNDETGNIEPIGFMYKLTGTLNGFEIIINIKNQKQVDSFRLRL